MIKNKTSPEKLTADQIRDLLPQRHPILFLDRVTELEPGVSAVGIKNITVNEPYFAGHFPQKFIVPGSHLIEVAAQLSAVMFTLGDDPSEGVGYLGEVSSFKFVKSATPGDRLVIHAECTGAFGQFKQVRIRIECEGQPVAHGTLLVVTVAEDHK